MIQSIRVLLLVLGAALIASSAAAQEEQQEPKERKMCSKGRAANTAMWLSIAKPGLGEWYLKGYGPIDNAPQHKFWFGLIPGYGWPGYLQFVSATDAANCKTNDYGE